MSFSNDIKQELAVSEGKARHCKLAELSAIVSFSGKLFMRENSLFIEMANPLTQQKFQMLVKSLFQSEKADAFQILESIKMWDAKSNCFKNMDAVDGLLIQQSCCRRAFIRGAFLSAGSMSDPEKSYHFEIVCQEEEHANQLQEIINSFEMDAKIVRRKKSYVVYLKEGAQIVDILNIMEAHVALMNLENVRILKEMRNFVNRQVNCETANINKTVSAAVKQVEDINYIKSIKGLDSLPDSLKEIALLRLQYPQAALKELGTLLNPPVGKSGVNHRLRKLCQIAEDLKQAKKR